jgi:sulfate transport system permease protein
MAGQRVVRGVLPGFGLTLGITLSYLGLLVLLPLGALLAKGAQLPAAVVWRSLSSPRVLAAVRFSVTMSLLSAAICSVVGLLVAWVLVRYRFLGRALLDALVDVPFALPTAVAGIALTALYAPTGLLGRPLLALGLRVAFAPAGVVVALVFVGLPFVVRTLQPVLADLDPAVEEAAAVLGASRLQTVLRLILPTLRPALLTGFALAFARAIGEYGSIVFISGNLPLRTEIVPLLIVTKLEQYDYPGATALAVAMLSLSFGALLVINVLQSRLQRRSAAQR